MRFIALCIFVGFFLLVGCKKSETSNLSEWMEDNGKVKVLSTTGMIDDLVAFVGQDKINHLPLIVGDVDPHSYELVKGDQEKLAFAEIVFFNGLGLEHGASLHYQLLHHPFACDLGSHLQRHFSDQLLKVDGVLDPHIWMDVRLFSELIDPIVAALSEKSPENRDFFVENGKVLRQKMHALDLELRESMQALPEERRFLVTSHDAFYYFTRRYLASNGEEDWKKRFAAPEGLAPDGQLSSQDIRDLVSHITTYQIYALFPESNVSKASLRKIQKSSQEKVRISDRPLYGDSMGEEGSNAESYFKMMKHNVAVLVEELGGDQ